jgi:hypothetical protein
VGAGVEGDMSPRKWRGLTPLEKSVGSECDRLCTMMGWDVVRFSQSRATRQTRGIPDRKYYRDEDTFWFECKAEGGRQSVHQKAFQKMCEAAGETYLLGGLVELLEYLNRRNKVRRA